MSENDTSTTDTEHVKRIEEALEKIEHLRYVEVFECPYPQADVRVRVADHVENALINNGEFAQFHSAGYVGHHIEFEKQFIDLRYLHSETERSGDSR